MLRAQSIINKPTNDMKIMSCKTSRHPHRTAAALAAGLLALGTLAAGAADADFDALVKRLQADKPTFAKRQQDLLNERYEMADRPASGVTMSRGKPVQGGVRVKLPAGVTWDRLAAMSPEEIKRQNLWPAGFYALPHPHHEAGGMIFPQAVFVAAPDPKARAGWVCVVGI